MRAVLFLLFATSAFGVDLRSMRSESTEYRASHFAGVTDDALIERLIEVQNGEFGEKAMHALCMILIDSPDEVLAQRAADALLDPLPYWNDEGLKAKNEKLIHWLMNGKAGHRPLNRLLSCRTIATDKYPPSSFSTFRSRTKDNDPEVYRRLIAAIPRERTFLQNKLADSWLVSIWITEKDPAAVLARMREAFLKSRGTFTDEIRHFADTLWAFGDLGVHRRVIAEIIQGHVQLMGESRSSSRDEKEYAYFEYLSERAVPRSEIISLLTEALSDVPLIHAASAARLFYRIDKYLAWPLIVRAGLNLWEFSEPLPLGEVRRAKPKDMQTIGDVIERLGVSVPVRDPETRATPARVRRLLEKFDLHGVYMGRIRGLAENEMDPGNLDWIGDVFDIARLCKWNLPYMFLYNVVRSLLAVGMGHYSDEVRAAILRELKAAGVKRIAYLLPFSAPRGRGRWRAVDLMNQLGKPEIILRAFLESAADPEEDNTPERHWYADRFSRSGTNQFMENLLRISHLVPPGDSQLDDNARELIALGEEHGFAVQIGSGISQIPFFEDRMEAYTKAVHTRVAYTLSKNPNPQSLALLRTYGPSSRFKEVRETATHAEKFQAQGSESPVNCPQELVDAAVPVRELAF